MSAVQEFWLPSRGDTARGRWIPGPEGPTLILGAPDGRADHPWIDTCFAEWSGWGTLVALDMPLCGARTSDKLTQHGLDPSHPLAAQIRPDLERQLAADLCTVATRLARPVGGSRVAFVGSGSMISWYEAACAQADGIDLVLVSADPDDAWLDKVAQRVREL